MRTARSLRSRSVTGRSARSSSTNLDAPATPPGRATVYGTNGGIQLSHGVGLHLVSDKERYAVTTEEDDRFLGAFREFAAAILEERDPVPSGEGRPAPCWRLKRCKRRRCD